MAIYTTFPDTFEQFIKQYVIEEENEIEVVPLFRVMQAWEHYTNDIAQNLDNIYECINMINNNLYYIEETIEHEK